MHPDDRRALTHVLTEVSQNRAGIIHFNLVALSLLLDLIYCLIDLSLLLSSILLGQNAGNKRFIMAAAKFI
jgi:hypothetical protein